MKREQNELYFGFIRFLSSIFPADRSELIKFTVTCRSILYGKIPASDNENMSEYFFYSRGLRFEKITLWRYILSMITGKGECNNEISVRESFSAKDPSWIC